MGLYDAIVLAEAGLARMGWDDRYQSNGFCSRQFEDGPAVKPLGTKAWLTKTLQPNPMSLELGKFFDSNVKYAAAAVSVLLPQESRVWAKETVV